MKHPGLFRGAIALVALAIGSGYKEVAPPARVVLPPARTPAESLAAIKVAAGFEVELVACEPQVMDPIDVAWGADGRMWVVEMADYPLGLDGKGRPGGRVRFLESTRGDGHYDKSTLFADGLKFPTSVLPWRGGVLVTTIPNILFLEDTDGDGRADRTTVVLGGVGEGNPQHLANGLQWGLDGWLHLANGNSGGKLTTPQRPTPLEVGQRDFRFDPETGRVETLAGQTQAGRNRDDWGNWFGCNNSNPIWHYALEEHYLRRNPHFVPPNATVPVSNPPGAARVFPVSETLARFNDPQGLNHFTSACGVMIYRDELLGADCAGDVFVCEPVHNLVHRERVRPDGATFASQRVAGEESAEFLASADNWSRFCTVRAGPDGALYVVDMYRLVIEHPQWIPEAWQKQLGDLRVGETMGRIYRVRPKDVALRPWPRLDRAEAGALVAALESPSGLVRDLAHQQLAWRRETAAAPALEKLAAGAPRAASRAQALWALDAIGRLTPAAVARALGDAHAGVRRQAVRLSERFAETAPELLAAVAACAADADAGVRQQAGYTLGEWTAPAAGVALARLLRGETDRWVRAAAMTSALRHAETVIAELGASGRGDDPTLMEIAAATENSKALASILTAIAAVGSTPDLARQFASLGALLDWLDRNNKPMAQLQRMPEPRMAGALAAVDAIFAAAREAVAAAERPVALRIAAAKVLGRGRAGQAEDFERLASLLTPQTPVELQLAAVASIGRMNRPAVPERLLAGWLAYGPAMRAAVLDALCSRPTWTHVLLDRVESDPAMLAQIDAGRRVVLTEHSNAALAKRAAAIFNTGVDRDRQRVIERYLASSEQLRGDAASGAKIFSATCTACHKFGAVDGRPVGPDLAVVKDRSAGYLVTHILDPNRAVEDRYVLYTVTLRDGRALAGMLTGEASHSITVIGLDGVEQTVLRSEIRALASTGRSLMPDGLEAAVNEQAMADLVAFLAGAPGAKN